MRRPLVIYDFATAPFWITLYMWKILFSFLSVVQSVLPVSVIVGSTFLAFCVLSMKLGNIFDCFNKKE
jgi:hypothetical protein